MQSNEDLLKDVEHLTDEQLMARIRMLDSNMRIMRNERSRVEHEIAQFNVRIKDNEDKIEKNRVLPYLVANIVEVIDVEAEVEQNQAAMNA